MSRIIFCNGATTLSFSQIWEKYSDFKEDYDALIVGFEENVAPVKATSLKTIFYLLFAQYGNNPIANSDVDQFKMKVVSIIYAYGPTWEKKQSIQKAIRDLTEADLLQGAKQIYNHALNPSSEPTTAALTELEYINDQNTANYKKSKMEAYSILWGILHADATRDFLDKFRKCFAVFVDKMITPFYIENDDDFIVEDDEG